MSTRLASDAIRLTLDGQPVELIPSLRAALTLARHYGTFGVLIEKISQGHTQAMADTIAAGARFPTALLAVLAEIEANGVLGVSALLQPTLIGFVVSLYEHVTDNGDEDDDQTTSTAHAGETITIARRCEQLFEIATGVLGWTPAEAWSATPAEIMAAYRGRMSLLKMIFGSGDTADQAKPKENLTLDQKARLFFAGRGTKRVGRAA